MLCQTAAQHLEALFCSSKVLFLHVKCPEKAPPEGGDVMASKLDVPHTQIHRLTRQFLEPAQDVLVVTIGLALFGLMIRTIGWLIIQIFRKPNLDFRQVIAEVLFMLVMVEVVRLVIIYLREHRVAVDFMVELGIVATLREVVLRGVTDLAWQQLAVVTLFLLALGALLRFGGLRSTEDGSQPAEKRIPGPSNVREEAGTFWRQGRER